MSPEITAPLFVVRRGIPHNRIRRDGGKRLKASSTGIRSQKPPLDLDHHQ